MDKKVEQINEYIRLNALKKEQDAQLKETKSAIAGLQEELLDHFVDNGFQKMTMKNGTVYIHVQKWAGVDRGDDGKDPDAVAWPRAIAALQSAGLDDFVQERFNTQSLSAFVRELDKNDEELPDEFKGAIKVTEKVSLRVRKR